MDELVVHTPQQPSPPPPSRSLKEERQKLLRGGGGGSGGPRVTVGTWACAQGAVSPVGRSTHACSAGQ